MFALWWVQPWPRMGQSLKRQQQENEKSGSHVTKICAVAWHMSQDAGMAQLLSIWVVKLKHVCLTSTTVRGCQGFLFFRIFFFQRKRVKIKIKRKTLVYAGSTLRPVGRRLELARGGQWHRHGGLSPDSKARWTWTYVWGELAKSLCTVKPGARPASCVRPPSKGEYNSLN